MKQYETVIGLEVHVELATKTKIFCSCSTEFGGAPNTHTCPVCTGMPGSLPVLNKQVVEYAMAVGLATNCDITRNGKFDRKNYFYPDNPQNYQISQLYKPICTNGYVEIKGDDGEKKQVRIHEIHMEEDAGKLVHDDFYDCSLVDLNRSGVPLIEIVSEPDMRSADEVVAYLEKLRMIIQYLGASDCKLNEGSMRADVNLSVREVGASEFGTRTEMKNLNSFKAIARAIENERERQIDQMERDVENLCMRLLLQQQPVARDLRIISSALKMISDMERIGDQAADIAEIVKYMADREIPNAQHLKNMSEFAMGMLSSSINAFVEQNADKARKVILDDDVVDSYFERVKADLIESLTQSEADKEAGQFLLDILMIAKYIERVGDHATNIAEWVVYGLTGAHPEETN